VPEAYDATDGVDVAISATASGRKSALRLPFSGTMRRIVLVGSRGARMGAALALGAVVAGALVGALALAGPSTATSPNPPRVVIPASATSNTAGPAGLGPATRGNSGSGAAAAPPQAASSTSTTSAPTPGGPAPTPTSSSSTTTTEQPVPQIGAPAGGTCPTAVCYGP
jgi:hypothetical protein